VLDLVDHRQLGVALLGFLEQACVSSNSRALSSATPALAATVASRCTSASLNASSRW
jgi:hypothetical protein